MTTNCEEKIGVGVLKILEAAYGVFVREFDDTFEIHEPARKMRINLYASKGALVAKLKKLNPNINAKIAIGNYSFTTGESYFYYFEDNNSARERSNTFLSTCVHEAVHQMFDQVTEVSRFVGKRPQFWVIEGMADYFGQTFSYDPVASSIGSLHLLKESSRWAYLHQGGAIYNTLNYVKQDQEEFASGDVGMQYAQAATLAYFLMKGKGGKYRQRFKAYTKFVHSGEAESSTFSTFFSADLADIHREYQRFLER